MKKTLSLILLMSLFFGALYAQNNPVIISGNPELKGFKTRNFVQLTLQGGFMVPVGTYLSDNYFNSAIACDHCVARIAGAAGND